ncbi:C3a anaphylatoxin chemotactic receptor-like [Hemitrygon akajei]|uniref:C3a anaphylatoxin chemotactic receptor-like n=1 Tax=Hemitrygon akajei TaxID=2704970 RepID=UPI003BFA37F9
MSCFEYECWARCNVSMHANPGNEQVSIIVSKVIVSISFVLGVPGNGAVIWVTGFKMKRMVHVACFLNLAVADLIICLTFAAGMLIEELRHLGIRRDIQMILFYFVMCFSCSAAVFLLILISTFRCLSVTRPIWFRLHLRDYRADSACKVAWGLAFLVALIGTLHEKFELEIEYETRGIWNVSWAISIFGIPVLIMAACNLVIVWKLYTDKFAMSSKTIYLTLTVVAAFIICWLPFHCCSVAKSFCNDPTIFCKVSCSLVCFNSALNPFLYVFVGRDFCLVFRRSVANSISLAFTEEGQQLENYRPDITVTTVTGFGGTNYADPQGSEVP